MFKTDKESLEELSFHFNERDIANLMSILEYLKSNDGLTISSEEFQRLTDGLKTIGRLKLDGNVYGFHVYDNYAEDQSGDCEGVELYLRQGDKLRDFHVPCSRDFVYTAKETTKYLKEREISTIYTGNIPIESGFLGLNRECDEEDPIIREKLDEAKIEEFESEGIKVVTLDNLI